MFVLVLMSMGQRGGILLDRNSQPVDLVKIRDLLSPFKFPAMRGKPKMLIIQACSGGKFCIIVTTCRCIKFIQCVSIIRIMQIIVLNPIMETADTNQLYNPYMLTSFCLRSRTKLSFAFVLEYD